MPLIDELPPVRGTLTSNAPLKDSTWFRVGGTAEVLYSPADSDDLCAFLMMTPKEVPLTLLGLGSNTLIRDGGIKGVVLKLGASFSTIETNGMDMYVGAAAVDITVAREAQKQGIGGLTFLTGIPGTIGGALRMNAGAYGGEMADITISVDAVTRNGEKITLSPKDMGFSYRSTAAASDLIFTRAHLRGTPESPDTILSRMQEIQKERGETQPVRERTGGSTFANPKDDPQNRRAWELIEAAGCRGLSIGGAVVSDKHCNFLINTGDATAKDIESLGEEVRRRVLEKTGINLHWEIKRVGEVL